MSTYNFSRAQRYAVWNVNGERCWLCHEPLSLGEATIDHVIPESLIGSQKLPGILASLGRPVSFRINSYENWAPAHRKCNELKKAKSTIAPAIAYMLDDLAKRAPKAAEMEQKFASNRKIEIAIEQLQTAKEIGLLSQQHQDSIKGLVEFHLANRFPEEEGKPFLLEPGLTVVAEDGSFVYLKGPGPLRGIRPKGDRLDPSWDCPRCGVTGWNGARCIRCGMLDDGD